MGGNSLAVPEPTLPKFSQFWVACFVLAAAALVTALPHGGFRSVSEAHKRSERLREAQVQAAQVSVRLKIEDSRGGMVGTISQRDDAGNVIGRPSILLVVSKEEVKQQAKKLARSLGLKVYGIVDKTGTSKEPRPWLVPGVGKSI
jgi:hypothetical protein